MEPPENKYEHFKTTCSTKNRKINNNLKIKEEEDMKRNGGAPGWGAENVSK